MKRLRISIIFGNEPNFNKAACKYFILYLNKLQSTYEFSFPDILKFPFEENKYCEYDTANSILNDFALKNGIITDHLIAITTNKFSNNYFFNNEEKNSVITTYVWDKYFSPPSLFEYLLHSIYCCLIYSQKTLPNTVLSKKAQMINIGSHKDTRGCVADFTRNKSDDRIDIILGYICDEHKKEIKKFYGKNYLIETTNILERKWIGNINDKDSVAYNLKHIFKFDINKDSGFNKTNLEKICEKFYEMPYELASEILKLVITVLLTYLLLKLGLATK